MNQTAEQVSDAARDRGITAPEMKAILSLNLQVCDVLLLLADECGSTDSEKDQKFDSLVSTFRDCMDYSVHCRRKVSGL